MASEVVVLPENHFRNRVANQYGDIETAIVREVLQNSQDAQAKMVHFSFNKGEWSSQDDGKGMTLDQFRSFYLTLGGTLKDTNSIGGFGAAKEVLSYAWENWLVKSQGFSCAGQFAGSVESFEGQGLDKGFFVGASDDYFDNPAQFDSALQKVVGLSDLSVKVQRSGEYWEKEDISSGRKLRKNQVVYEYDFGTLYVHKSTPNDFEAEGTLYIRTNGLYSFEDRIPNFPYVAYLDLSKPSPEVLTENRDGLRYEIRVRVLNDLGFLTKNIEQIETRSHSRIKVYGSYCAKGSTYTEQGSFDIDDCQDGIEWRKTFAVCEEGIKAKGIARKGYLVGKYAHMLEVWSTVLNLVSDEMGLDRFMPGLYFGTVANAIHSNLGGVEMCGINPECFEENGAFALFEVAVHEIAHHYKSSHCQEFETARMSIMRKLGEKALGIVFTIQQMMNEKPQGGAYWV